MYHEGLHEVVWVRSNWLTDEHLIFLPAGIFHCSTVRSLIMAPVYRCKMCDAPSVKVQDVWPSLGRGTAVVVDPGYPSSIRAVIRKQLVVGCILLY